MSARQVVWFKRDLRTTDHAPLQQAVAQVQTHGPVLCLYCIEPALWAQPDAARQHYHFVLECLTDLREQLAQSGLQLLVAVGDAPQQLALLHSQTTISALLSHEETGNFASFERDKAVAAWCKSAGVQWLETPQFGVKRGLQIRSRWALQWQQHMAQAVQPAPNAGAVRALPPPPALPSADDLGLASQEPPSRQRGGRARGLSVLHSFLSERSAQYRGGISSPLKAPTACSRLSPYLALGCLSMREVVQAVRTTGLAADIPAYQRLGLNAMLSRLHWHCHFIQKLESEPEIEWRNMHQGYNGLRENDWNNAHFKALVNGRTGWPMVDASVAMLNATGWINFRMRAMLVSVAAYPLWLHWRDVGTWLATQFLDYEPGIHWSQLQMQSGTTGINTTRVYNPIKQAQDHDPKGLFVRRWLPAMRRVPDTWLFEPWRMPPSVQQQCGVRVGADIAMPLVELDTATRLAKQRLHGYRQQDHVRAGKAAIVKRHASQSGDHAQANAQGQRRKRTNSVHTTQQSFGF